MCPLRVILIFLSATLAGFFLLRNLRSQPSQLDNHDDDDNDDATQNSHSSNPSSSSKIGSAINSGFWTLVDMASGRYLWRHRHLLSSTQSS